MTFCSESVIVEQEVSYSSRRSTAIISGKCFGIRILVVFLVLGQRIGEAIIVN
jgi:hypothetical protein